MKTEYSIQVKSTFLLLLFHLFSYQLLIGQEVAEYKYFPNVPEVLGYKISAVLLREKETIVKIRYSKSSIKSKYGAAPVATLTNYPAGKILLSRERYKVSTVGIPEATPMERTNTIVLNTKKPIPGMPGVPTDIELVFAAIDPLSTSISINFTNLLGTKIEINNIILERPIKTGILPALSATVTEDDDSFLSPIVTNKPYASRVFDKSSSLEKIERNLSYTTVYISYVGPGSIYCSPNYYIQDTETKKKYALIKANGVAVDPGRTAVQKGQTRTYSLIFEPIPLEAEVVDIIEPVSGGFSFWDVNLKDDASGKNSATNDSELKLIKEIVIPSDVKKVVLNDFNSDFQFSDGMLAIYNRELRHWGFINEQGEVAIPYQWDYGYTGRPRFDKGCCTIAKETKTSSGRSVLTWYVLDKKGLTSKIAGDIVRVSQFCDGYAAVIKRVGSAYKYAYINAKGLEVFPGVGRATRESHYCPDPRPYQEGRAAFYDFTKKKYGFIDKTGRVVIPAIYSEVADFSEGLAAVKVAAIGQVSDWGFIDANGVMKIPAIFSNKPSSFSEGYAAVRKRNGSAVMIDKNGEVASPEFDALMPFHNGHAFASLPNRQHTFVINKNFRTIKGPLEYFEMSKTPFVFHNNVCVKSAGMYPAELYTYTGERFIQEYGWSFDTISENLFYCKCRNFEGFANYKGEMVFLFVKSEF